ncbi:unnamed protein product [Meganyctiphanes norvegica]|uniref:Protein kinase domain-containing protein n=1 Tax=Meganyctiphanes norvegica TaxID=48144 RepID=A0AAV2RRZ5_MEGNR
MCYRLVDMVATDKSLQDEEFYSEYLKWKRSDTPSLSKEILKPCSPEKDRKRKRRRQLFKSKSRESGNTNNLPFLIKHGEQEKVDKIILNKKELHNEICWSNLKEGKKICDLEDARLSKAIIMDGDDTIKACVKIYNKMPPIDTLYAQENALTALKGIRGIPHLHGIITHEEPAAIIMSIHPGRTLREYIEEGDTLMSLMAFSDICKIFEKIHSLSWAHYGINSSNIRVTIGDKGRVRATIIDFTYTSPVQSNPYSNLENLPTHLPEDVFSQQCEGDLVDRYSLCYIANEICCKMVDAAETKTLRRAVKRGLSARTLPHARKRTGPLALARMLNILVGKNTHISWKFDLDK